MKIFLDSADLNEIRKVAELGVCDGVTTNPTLIAKSGQDFKTVLKEIVSLIPGPISAEVVSTEHKGMLAEAEVLAKLNDNIVIKLPLTPEGLRACKVLSGQGVRTNVTLCFQAGQALLAAKCGATYISPFIGRLDDVSIDGMTLIRDIRTIYDNYGYETEILAASIRHPRHVIDSALAGADVATCPYKIIAQLYSHPLTDKGLAAFLEDWKQSGQKAIV
ncbi:MAG: fructose-6-phosphate aldolase [Silvanigrellales bacterium]|jgi:transaldolase|nr:fructose-6-phosphate aldolase [Silvanigrellales bacterium]